MQPLNVLPIFETLMFGFHVTLFVRHIIFEHLSVQAWVTAKIKPMVEEGSMSLDDATELHKHLMLPSNVQSMQPNANTLLGQF